MDRALSEISNKILNVLEEVENVFICMYKVESIVPIMSWRKGEESKVLSESRSLWEWMVVTLTKVRKRGRTGWERVWQIHVFIC